MNPFVNPHQRGIDLPPGCKDLIDVLKPSGSSSPRLPKTERLPGTDARYFEAPLHRFYESKGPLGLGILLPQAVITLLRRPEPPRMAFTFTPSEAALKTTVHSILTAQEISLLSEDSLAKTDRLLISYSLPVSAPKTAEIISLVLQNAYGHTGPVNLVMFP